MQARGAPSPARRSRHVATLVLLVAAPAAAQITPAESLRAILDEHVEWHFRENPVEASTRGDERFNDQLRDDSPEAYERRVFEMTDRLDRLKSFDQSLLTEDDVVNAELLIYELETAIASAGFRAEQMPLDARSGPQIWLPQMADSLRFATPKHYADFATRLEALAQSIDATIVQMRRGLEAKRVPPRVAMLGADAQAIALASEAVVASPESSLFFRPFAKLAADDPAAARARAAIQGGIAPAFRRLGEFLRDIYIPACRESLAAADLPEGKAYYDFLLRSYTTTNLPAERIHEIGLEEVARIRAEMLEVIGRTDFPKDGSLTSEQLFDAFVHYLRTAPRFYFTEPEALLARYRDICKTIDPELPRLFGVLPRNTYGVRELPAFSAPTSPTGYYYPGSSSGGVSGWFMVNTYRLDQRPRYEMIALALHESVPGHHFQISITQELEQQGLHPFRTLTGWTAFVEGWALYAERLGREMNDGKGLYTDPYDDFGRLNYEMWRAARLVIDTGLHSKGWSRRQSIDYLMKNTALSPHNIEREVDRYIGWPGQACAYKIGELKIRELRAYAEKSLGDRFDLRRFHDCILGGGALPLPVLHARVYRWVQAEQSR